MINNIFLNIYDEVKLSFRFELYIVVLIGADLICWLSIVLFKMEGGGYDIKKLAYNEYMDSKDRSRFSSLAQKLAQHINHLSEDKNVRIRWIWELIQNAKDVPNEFGHCKIRVEIKENKLIFAHNGDPFRVSDLESLVAQYSSKPEENNTNTQTTGKYGTGFITTYILSRKVRIKGLLCIKNKDQMKRIQEQEKEEIKVGGKPEPPEENEDRFEDFEEEILHEKNKKKVKKFEGGSLFQRFEIFLDRDYKDRDLELFHKLMRTERNLLEDLLKNEPKPKWDRKIDELNTQFAYEDLDEAAFKMIEDAMICLKELFPYAMLFNSKLSEIQVIDRREGKRIKNFGFKRLEDSVYNGMKIFNVKVLEQGNDPRTFSIAYDEDEDSKSTIAMPVSLNDGKIMLNEVNHKFPKIFKEFPLIGCKDHGFNFIFTSKQFYPNESRSDLLLKQIEGRNSKKSETNWWVVQNIFKKGLTMYKKLAGMIAEGHQNLLVVSLKNQFTDQEHKEYEIEKLLLTFKEELSQIKFIQFKGENRGSLKELVFPYGSSEKKNCQEHEYSGKLNSCFAKLLGQKVTLKDDWYQKMYPYLMSYLHIWEHNIKFKKITDCIACFQKISYQNLVFTMDGQSQALDYLEDIYKFLHKHNTIFVTQKKQDEVLFSIPIPFVLTNKRIFKDLNERIQFKQLMKKDNVHVCYEDIALQLGIDIAEYTIFDKFAQYFQKTRKFGIDEMFAEFRNKFFVDGPIQAKEIVKLGKFLKTFSIKSDVMDLIKDCRSFQFIDMPFKVSQSTFQPKMLDSEKKQYRYLFELKVMFYFKEIINKCYKLSDLMPEISCIPEQVNQAIGWLNQLFRIEEQLIKKGPLCSQYIKARQFCPMQQGNGGLFGKLPIQKHFIEKSLTMSSKFVPISQLKSFCFVKDGQWYKGCYPDETDFQIYEKMRAIRNRTSNRSSFNINNLKDQIMHPKIDHKLAAGTTFKEKFEFIVALYQYSFGEAMNKNEKIELLDYIYNLRQASIKNPDLLYKVEVFADIQKKAYYDYPSMTNCISKRDNQAYIFHMIKNTKEIDAAIELNERYGNLAAALKKLKSLDPK